MANVWTNLDGTDFPQSAKGVAIVDTTPTAQAYGGEGATHPAAMNQVDGTVRPDTDAGWTWQKHTAAAE